MGSNKSGFDNENELITELNNKRVNELNSNLKSFIYFLFYDLDGNERISAYTGISGQKPDIIIKINNEIKNVSVKIGNGNSVHQEKVDLFINFLSSLKISKEIQNELLKFHWGDGTIDGTGTNRISSNEYKKIHSDKIEFINRGFNKNYLLKDFLNRFIFQGKSLEYDIVDVIYYGDIEKGHWASKEEIFDYILNNKFYSDSIHFGPLNYQIWNRCLNFNPKTENRRAVMQIKWPSLLQDILNIERKRNSYG